LKHQWFVFKVNCGAVGSSGVFKGFDSYVDSMSSVLFVTTRASSGST